MLTLLALLGAQPAAAGDELVDALIAEMERSQNELTLTDAPELYHLRYHLLTLEQVDAQASFGALVRGSDDPFNALGVEVRIGTPEFDNTNFGGWQTGFGRGWIPQRLTPETLALSAWRLTDGAYKEAVEQYARKQAQFKPPEDYPGDYTLTDSPAVADGGQAGVSEAEPLRDIARRVSGAMAVDAHIERAQVHVGHEGGAIWTVDTEGTRVRRPLQETSIRAFVHVRADDGMLLTNHLLGTDKEPAELPPVEQMEAQAKAMAEDLVAASEAPLFGEEYVGPVIFEDHAAVDLFRYLLLPQIEGTPGEIPFDTWLGDLGDSDDPVRLERRVLPSGWSVVDDPARDLTLPGTFTHDLEGTPAERVELITDGIVRDVLMSRIPRRGVDGTNGHARGMIGGRLSARATQLEIAVDKPASTKKMRKAALKVAGEYGRDYVIVVERLQEASVRNTGGGGFMFMGDGRPALPMPVSVKRLYADGTEERVRGVSFAGVSRFVLRDILSAGPQTEAVYMASTDGDASMLGPTEGMPTWLSAPTVVVGEMELVSAPGDPRDTPLVPPPELAAGQ